jgi:hypothetical protein
VKASRFIIICLLAFVLGSALGYFVGMRRGFHKAYAAEWSDHQERSSENLEFEARACLRCLQDIDSGDITNLHNFALTHLRVYVSDVQQMQAAGYTWAPHMRPLYSNAVVYVAEHPRQK